MPYHAPYLSKPVAARLVIEQRMKDRATLEAVNYDPIVREELQKKGIKCAPEGAHCSCL